MYEKSVYIGRGAFLGSVISMFRQRGWRVGGQDSTFLCLTGGADVNPELYDEKPLTTTYFSKLTDEYDIELFNQFKDRPKLGICRGGQIMNVLNGGKMWQHISNHERSHDAIDTRSKKRVRLSSIHHQMMIPGATGEVLTIASVADQRIGYRTAMTHNTAFPDDVETVYYPETKALCFQAHPEVGPMECTDYFFDLIEEKYFS